MSLYLSKHNLHPFTRWSGCFADQTLFPNRDRSKKILPWSPFVALPFEQWGNTASRFRQFFPRKRLAKLLCFLLTWIIGSKSHCQNGNAWNPMQIPKHKNAMGVSGWRMISCDCFVQKKTAKKKFLNRSGGILDVQSKICQSKPGK